MEKRNAFFVTILAGMLAAVPALAAGDACIQVNRIFSTKVVDQSTIVLTDKDMKPYTVHMIGACVGLNQNAQNLSFRTKTEIGCLTHGDSISYNLPGEQARVAIRPQTQTPCFVNSVTEGAPPARGN